MTEPFPDRERAFLDACALNAADFERSVQEVAVGWAEAQGEAAKQAMMQQAARGGR